ncbi:MAG: DUF3024 domain-containing protein [Candidatus Omnitrophica bacterium]|nr:DUF3024 domain-containing protein [Candidatus Omnitrophota bacterium]
MTEKIQIKDKLLFYILSKLECFGHEKLPLEIIKEKQSYIVGHRRKRWNSDEEFIEEACKITFIKSKNFWKLFWKRADFKWHLYEEYTNLDNLLDEVRNDPNGCFWG